MNPWWLVEAAGSNAVVLWGIAILPTACAVVTSRALRRAPIWRAIIIGTALMLFAAPVYGVEFDPWWRTPWPSVYLTMAVAAGRFDAAASFFEAQFIMPPVAWGLLAAVAWHLGYRAFTAQKSPMRS